MKEEFLHYLWKYKKFAFAEAKSTSGESITLINSGAHNHLAGPDFLNAQLKIDDQLWAGNVEIHLKSSGWYAHQHEEDRAYDNVILHVVWEDDTPVYGPNDLQLTTLVLKNYVNPELITGYRKLFYEQKYQFINCENDFEKIPQYLLKNWLERQYIDRLEEKVLFIEKLLKASNNDWEAVLFTMLARNFGTKINAQAFADMAGKIPFSVIRKISNNTGELEALFLGVNNLLPKDDAERQIKLWKEQYRFIQSKYAIDENAIPIQYFKLRPPNFPTIRLSQLANLYEKESNLFQKVVAIKTKKESYDLFDVHVSGYWKTHYNFGRSHSPRAKRLSNSFVDLLLINTIIPIQFAYSKYMNLNKEADLLQLIMSLKAEKNSIVEGFKNLRELDDHALNSQALLHLKKHYCDVNRCLHCVVGNYLISQSAKE